MDFEAAKSTKTLRSSCLRPVTEKGRIAWIGGPSIKTGVKSRAACLPSIYPPYDNAAPVLIELIKWPMEERNIVAEKEGRMEGRKTLMN